MQTTDYVNPRDLMFWLYEIGQAGELEQFPRYAEYGRADVEALLDAVTQLSDTEFDGLPELLDANEPRFDGRSV